MSWYRDKNYKDVQKYGDLTRKATKHEMVKKKNQVYCKKEDVDARKYFLKRDRTRMMVGKRSGGRING